MSSRHSTFLVGALLLAIPGPLHAEVADKIPGLGVLSGALALEVLLGAVMTWLLRRTPVAQVPIYLVMLLAGWFVFRELYCSDIGGAVRTEEGSAYVVLLWLLWVFPAFMIPLVVTWQLSISKRSGGRPDGCAG